MLKIYRIFGLVAITLLVSLGVLVRQSQQNKQIFGVSTDLTQDQIVELTNQKRQEAGLEPLVISEKLNKAAQVKAQNMVEHGVFDHYYETNNRPVTPWYFFDLVGYRYLHAGENLGKDFSSSTTLVKAWMDSPAHKENLLSPDYTEIGIGIVEGPYLEEKSTALIVQFFAKPADGLTQDVVVNPQENFKSTAIVSYKDSWISQTINKYPVVLMAVSFGVTLLITVAFIVEVSSHQSKTHTTLSADFWKT